MTTRRKTIIGIVAGMLVIIFGYIVLWMNMEFVDERPIIHTPEASVLPSLSPSPSASPTPAGENQQPEIKQYRLPPITTEEFNAPNFISASPAHKEAVTLGDLKVVSLKFSAPLESPSKIIVFAGNKVASSGGEISADGKALNLLFSGGAFTARNLQTGIYEVYYDACFVGDACYKGQYAFYGIQ